MPIEGTTTVLPITRPARQQSAGLIRMPAQRTDAMAKAFLPSQSPDTVLLPPRFGGFFLPKKSGIVSTLGPATDSYETIRELIQAGVTVFRLNFSHGTQEEHGQRIQWIRKATEELQAAGKLTHDIQIMADIQGPKIRVGKIETPTKSIRLKHGESIALSAAPTSSDPGVIPVTFPQMIQALTRGQKILIADGTMELVVTEAAGENTAPEHAPPANADKTVRCTVVRGGELTSSKGINLPQIQLNTPALSDKDKSDVRYALAQGVDLIAVSFVRSAKDMQDVRRFVETLQAIPSAETVQLFAKIEKPQAITREMLPKVVVASDGVMVARGDLGIEVDVVCLPGLQEIIIGEARAQGKPVIVATQMLESMMTSTVPSRAEVSDIADAVKDGADFVMLSGETSIGQYPVQAVKMMARIIEKYAPEQTIFAYLNRVRKRLVQFLRKTVSGLKNWVGQWFKVIRQQFLPEK